MKIGSGKTLRLHEWALVLVALLVCLKLARIAWSAPETRWPKSERKLGNRPKKLLVVKIKGEVVEEGRYHFEEGTTIGKALDTIALTDAADVSKFDRDKPLKARQSITVRKKRNLNK